MKKWAPKNTPSNQVRES